MHDRNALCVEAWPECEDGAYHPSCCRFPKSCSCAVVHDRTCCGDPADCVCDVEPTDVDLYSERAPYFAALADEPGSLGENDWRL